MSDHFRTIKFQFNDRTSEDLVELNKNLGARKLKHMEVKAQKGYLAVTKDGAGTVLGLRYGLDSITLEVQEDRKGFVYKIDTAVTPGNVPEERFLEAWRSDHPDQVIRILIRSTINEHMCYMIIHHEKIRQKTTMVQALCRLFRKDV